MLPAAPYISQGDNLLPARSSVQFLRHRTFSWPLGSMQHRQRRRALCYTVSCIVPSFDLMFRILTLLCAANASNAANTTCAVGMQLLQKGNSSRRSQQFE